MKNIHLIPTDKPSRLYKDDNQVLTLNTHPVLKGIFTNGIGSNQHIYITNSEEIKEGQNYIGDGFSGKNKFKWHKSQVETYPNIKKDVIFLTTDQDLIKDGVQSIDDEFLEWFVNNPSCESIEVCKNPFYEKSNYEHYKIIIPQQEDEKETIEEASERLSKDAYKKHSVKDNNLSLDEQIQRSGGFIVGFKEGMNEGAKCQAERMYSEEEILVLLHKRDKHNMDNPNTFNGWLTPKEWFEKHKKK
jgi:hypothetical protein